MNVNETLYYSTTKNEEFKTVLYEKRSKEGRNFLSDSDQKFRTKVRKEMTENDRE